MAARVLSLKLNKSLPGFLPSWSLVALPAAFRVNLEWTTKSRKKGGESQKGLLNFIFKGDFNERRERLL